MRRLARPFLVLLALVFLFEAWLWTHLAPAVASIVARIPLRAIKATIANWVENLPPAATLVVFVVPIAALLVPLKFLEVWMLVRGHWFGAIAVLAFAKVRRRRLRLHFRRDASQAAAACLVPPVLRPRDGVARLGARTDRSDQAPAETLFPDVGAETRWAHVAPAHAYPQAHAGHARRGVA